MSHMTVQTIPKGQRHVSVVKGVSLEEVLEKFIQRLILWKKKLHLQMLAFPINF